MSVNGSLTAADHSTLIVAINAAIVAVDVIGLLLNLPAVVWLVKHVNKTPMFFVLRAAGVTDVLLLAGQLVCSLATIVLHWCQCEYASTVLEIVGVDFVLELVHQCNLWLTVLMSVERFTAICRPYLHSRFVSRRRLWQCSIFIIVFSVIYTSTNLALLCSGDSEADGEARLNCTFVEEHSGLLFSLYTWYEEWHALLAIVDHVLAMLLLTASYAYILMELRLASKRWYELTLRRRSECSSSRMPACIIAIFFMFESPKVVMDVICVTGLMEIDHTELYRATTTLLLQLCTATNVVVYFLFSESIRKRLLHMCCVSDSRLRGMKLFHRLGSQYSRASVSAHVHDCTECEQNSVPYLTSTDSEKF